ncbi:UDP-glucose 4-epimerase GalE [Jatrophihabitans sp.]|jgi:UDP-glucose 4-epimerase|uniref:UDP-glucose 4-epimerase GalE n=1 Tax=Jatrophihabitans sp. TaxID=1932789 RepID=UPI002EE51192
MRVLVTGGAGYIGSVVTAELLSAGHQVTVLDNLSTGHADAVPAGAEFVEAGITEADPVLAAGGFDAVVHFAAKSLVPESVTAPELYWHNNTSGTLALLESMRRHDVRTIVFSSTAATYGEPDSVPILESSPTRPTNPYGASKLAVDHMLTSYARAHGFSAVSLRYFNVAGARITPENSQGERHATETHLIPIALQVAAGLRPQLQVNGVHYPTPDGSCVRDYIHVLDLADAHLRALERATRDQADGSDGQGSHLICNLGSGSGSSVREVIESVRRITGRPTPAVDAPNRAGDPAVLIASNDKAAAELGWRPTRDLDRMVADAWQFFQQLSPETAGSTGADHG